MQTYHPCERRYFWRRVVSAVALMLGLAIVAAGGSARGAPSPEPPATAVTIGERIPLDTDGQEPVMDPFPVTESMTDTVKAILEAYNAARIQARPEPVAVAARRTKVFLPMISGGRSTPPPTPTDEPEPEPERADIALVIWPNPSIHVARGGTLEVELRVKNYGDGDASRVRVRLPYDEAKMTLSGEFFVPGSGDRLNEWHANHVTVTFARVDAGEYRPAKLFFNVAPWLPDNTVIDLRATYEWRDGGGTEDWLSNWAPVLAWSGNDSADWLWLEVTPVQGYPGTTHRFYTDRFIPGEGIITWLNTPAGVRQLSLRTRADDFGVVEVDFSSSGLGRGTYSMVLYGARSNLTAIATFYVW